MLLAWEGIHIASYVHFHNNCSPPQPFIVISASKRKDTPQYQTDLQTTSTNQVHWIDNFARHFAMHGIHLGTLLDLLSCCLLGKELFKKTLWTAHGVKLIPANVKMAHVMKGSNPIPASPPFPPLVSDDALTRLYNRLAKINHYQYAKSECVLRDVRRVPLKPEGDDAEEVKHLALFIRWFAFLSSHRFVFS